MAEQPILAAQQLLQALNRYDVEYVLIGGLAAVLWGSPLRTDDADICPARGVDNLKRLASALGALHARIALPDDPGGIAFPHDPEFLGRVEVWNLVTRYGSLDIAFSPSGTGGYDDLKRAAAVIDIGGLEVPVASLADIIRSKEAASRDKDHRALPVLRQLLERLDEQP
ncbi:MAG: hypothetical protein WD080_02585 [Egibacteraceae bacterium]